MLRAGPLQWSEQAPAAQPGVTRLILHPPPAHAHLNALGKEKEIKASIRGEGQIQIKWQKQLLPFKQFPPGLLRRPRLHSPCLTVPRSELQPARSWFWGLQISLLLGCQRLRERQDDWQKLLTIAVIWLNFSNILPRKELTKAAKQVFNVDRQCKSLLHQSLL